MMRYRITCALFFLLIVKAASSQHDPINNYNILFDKVITSDRTIPVVEYKGPLPHPRRKAESNNLVFDPEYVSMTGTVRAKMNDHRYSHQAKIKFLKDAMAYKEKDLLAYIEDYPSDYIAKHADALQLVKDYLFKGPNSENRWLEFRIRNSMPGYVELMEEYVKNRPTLQKISLNEGELMGRLLLAGKEKIAFELMKAHVDDWLAGKIKYIHCNDRENDTNIWDLFCFSRNNDIRTEARSLFWKCMEHKWSPYEYDLAVYLDEKRATALKELNKDKEVVKFYTGNDKRVLDAPQVVADLKSFGLGEVPPSPDLPDYWKFACWRRGFDWSMQRVFSKTDLVRRPTVKDHGCPVPYKTNCWIWFEPMLENIGIYDIEAQEVVEKVADGYTYKLFICSNEAAYKLEFKDAEEECIIFQAQRIIKMINLLLIKKGVKERFVEVATNEENYMLGFFEPRLIKPFFNKYETACFAVHKGDAFDKLK